MRKVSRRYKKISEKYKIIIGFSVIILLLVSFIYVKKLNEKKSLHENVTTKLTVNEDFFDWFVDFDKLYKQKVETPVYTVNSEYFEIINDFLINGNNENIYFRDNIYYINDDITIELDVNTRSFRYIKYTNNLESEILEVNLINGKYYVILANSNKICKISFNSNKVKNKCFNNKNEKVSIDNSIFGTNNFEW